MPQTPIPTIDELVDKVNGYLPSRDGAVIRRAFEVAREAHASQMRKDGSPYISHCLATANILANLGLDPDTIAAGLLHDTLEDTLITKEQLQSQFGSEITTMVDGVTKLSSRFDQAALKQGGNGTSNGDAAGLSLTTPNDYQSENLRKMFLAMAQDVRVVLIKLADRLHNMRTLGAKEGPAQRRIAQETMDIYVPLANRLGIWQLKWELEDLAFRYLEPDKYREIAAKLKTAQAEREEQVKVIIKVLEQRLSEEGIQAQITGRPKHIASIYRKMMRKKVPLEEVYDLYAVRVLVDSERDCYSVLGIVHGLWSPVPGEFDDYIARPKDNLYKSLHTAVIGPDGKPFEVQIRTHEMHQEAEYGIAAHWRYKEQGKADPKLDEKIAWLRQILDWRRDVDTATEYVDALKSDVFRDQVYVFTPKGEIVELPAGSTPIDFAYHIHSAVGDRCRGALVNGRIVPLDYQLKTGERVEILTHKNGTPSRDWLNPNLGYVRTARAREKIRSFFRRQLRSENIRQGREMIDKELKRLGLEKTSYESIARLFKIDKVDDFLAKVGEGDINLVQVAARLGEVTKDKDKDEPLTLPAALPQSTSAEGLTIDGIGSLMTRTARCCNPLPGEEVVGFITMGRGLTLHRPDCAQLDRMDPARLVRAYWPANGQQVSQIAIRVVAIDRPGLVRDISDVVAKDNINMTAVSTSTNPRTRIAVVTAVLELTGLSQLSRVLDKVGRLPNVVEAKRV